MQRAPREPGAQATRPIRAGRTGTAAATSARVCGCRGRGEAACAAGPCSTMRPSNRIATSSASDRHQREVVRDEEVGQPVARAQVLQEQAAIWAWIEASRPVKASSRTRSRGSTASARAMASRCRWPPLSSSGRRPRPGGRRRRPSPSARARASGARRGAPRPAMSSGSDTISAAVSRGSSAAAESWRMSWTRCAEGAQAAAAQRRAGRRRRTRSPRRRLLQPGQAARERGLARAGLADQRQRRARARSGRRRAALRPARVTRGARRPAQAADVQSGASASMRTQRTWRPASVSAAPADARRSGTRSAQRGSKAHPAPGGRVGGAPGWAPANAGRRAPGRRAKSPRVYGCSGRRRPAPESPTSTMRPAYMTTTRRASAASDAQVVARHEHGQAEPRLQSPRAARAAPPG